MLHSHMVTVWKMEKELVCREWKLSTLSRRWLAGCMKKALCILGLLTLTPSQMVWVCFLSSNFFEYIMLFLDFPQNC